MLLQDEMNNSHSSYATHSDAGHFPDDSTYTQSPAAHPPPVTPGSTHRSHHSSHSSYSSFSSHFPHSPHQSTHSPHQSPHSPLSHPGLNMTLPMKRREERQRKLLRQRQQQLQRQNQMRPAAPLTYGDDQSFSPTPSNRTSFTPAPFDDDSYHARQDYSMRHSRDDEYHRPQSPRSPHTLVINNSYSYDATPPSPIRPRPVRPQQHYAPYRQSHSFDSSSPTPESINVISPHRCHQRFPSDSSHSIYDYRDYRQEPQQPQREPYYESQQYPYTPHGTSPMDNKLPLVTDSFDTHEKDPILTEDPNAPVVQPSPAAICANTSEVNSNDVLCGRGGGTNSQVGNRRFRKLVQDYQPIYLTARRKEKPVIARNIVRMIRQRGGRFLKKDDANESLWEVGDERAEAKTSQALREGLDVRASKGVKKESGRETPKRGHGERLAGEMFVENTKKRELEVVLRNDEERRLFSEFAPPMAKMRKREESDRQREEHIEQTWSPSAV